jgi:hypothetical protein
MYYKTTSSFGQNADVYGNFIFQSIILASILVFVSFILGLATVVWAQDCFRKWLSWEDKKHLLGTAWACMSVAAVIWGLFR